MKNLLIFLWVGFILAELSEFGFIDSKPYLTPTSSPTNSININWNTEISESTVVAYGLTQALTDTVRILGMRNYHHAMLTGLAPATEYFYRVLPYESVKKFKTFPLQSDSFSFIVFGDTRGDSAIHQSVVNQIASCEFDFIMHTGDLVNKGDNIDDWRTFFNVEDTLLQSQHFMPVIGNHEKPYWQYDTFFALPDEELFYSFKFANAYYIMLNTQIDLHDVQRDWFINELATVKKDTAVDWIFVVLHRPLYTSGRYGYQHDVRDAWSSIFEEYGVDIVFAGHDHIYERTEEINGVIYIISGGGSAPLYSVGRSSWTAYSESTYHFCLVKIAKRRVSLYAIKPNGVIFDSLFLDKG